VTPTLCLRRSRLTASMHDVMAVEYLAERHGFPEIAHMIKEHWEHGQRRSATPPRGMSPSSSSSQQQQQLQQQVVPSSAGTAWPKHQQAPAAAHALPPQQQQQQQRQRGQPQRKKGIFQSTSPHALAFASADWLAGWHGRLLWLQT
jgi:hypothetical protein